MDYLQKMILEHLIPAIFTTFGVFIPTLFIMYLNFLRIKYFYYRNIPQITEALEKQKENFRKRKDQTQNLIKKLENLNDPLMLQFQLDLIKDEWNIQKQDIDIRHMEDFSFSRYLFSIINRRFPDSHWQKR